MKYFFIDGDFKVTYDELLEHIQNRDSFDNAYGKVLSIITNLTGDNAFPHYLMLKHYLENNATSKFIDIQTSGTTGEPKTISQSLANVMRQVKPTSENNVWAFAYNPNHFAGLQVLFQALMNQNTIVYVFDKDFEQIPGLLTKYNVTHLACTPTFMNMILPHINELPALQRLSFGGERLPERLLNKAQNKLPNVKIKNIYASSEAGSILASDGKGFYIPSRYQDVVKIDENELCIHKSLLGYFDMEDEWYRTGDTVKFIDDNLFEFDSRKSEIINTGGYRVSPAKVENFISTLEGVSQVRVYGRENSVIGTVIAADIVATGNITELKSKIKSTNELTDYEKPRSIKLVQSIEVTNTGKLKRS